MSHTIIVHVEVEGLDPTLVDPHEVVRELGIDDEPEEPFQMAGVGPIQVWFTEAEWSST